MILLCNFFPAFTITVITKAQKQKSLIDVLKKLLWKFPIKFMKTPSVDVMKTSFHNNYSPWVSPLAINFTKKLFSIGNLQNIWVANLKTPLNFWFHNLHQQAEPVSFNWSKILENVSIKFSESCLKNLKT